MRKHREGQEEETRRSREVKGLKKQKLTKVTPPATLLPCLMQIFPLSLKVGG